MLRRRFTIALSGLSETQKRSARIADNKIALNAGRDLEILQLELSELASIDVDIDPTLTGFSTGEIDVILSSAADPDDQVIPPVSAASHSASQTATRSKIHSAEVCSGVASFGSGLAVYGLELPSADLGEISLEEEVEQSSNHCDDREAHQLVPARGN
jgi:hypothetical protein